MTLRHGNASRLNGVKAMGHSRKTGARAGSAESKVLRDGRTSKAAKTAAGSALSQRPQEGER